MQEVETEDTRTSDFTKMAVKVVRRQIAPPVLTLDNAPPPQM